MSAGNREELVLHLAELEKGEGEKFFSLADCVRLLSILGEPQNRFQSIHIVGTNGKGSVGAMLAAIFRAEGKSVGHAPSPHLFERSERCLVNGAPCDPEIYIEKIAQVFSEAAKVGLMPSFFMATFAATMLEFVSRGVDWAMIEAGVGGVDDATNVLASPAAAVVTSVGFDHMRLLGNSLREIAEKKAKIAKRGVPLFAGDVPEDAREAIISTARSIGAPLEVFGVDFSWSEKLRCLKTPSGDFALSLEKLALSGAFQKRNAVLAARTAYALGFSEKAVHQGLETVRWPGRFETFSLKRNGRSQTVLLDVAHNEEGTRSLGIELDMLDSSFEKLVLVVSMLDRKDHRAALSNLLQSAPGTDARRSWVCTSSRHSHVLPPEELARFLSERGEENVRVIEDPCIAFDMAVEIAGKNCDTGLVVVTGSLYLISKIRPLCSDLPFRTIVEISENSSVSLHSL